MGLKRMQAFMLVIFLLCASYLPVFSDFVVDASYQFSKSYTLSFDTPEFSTLVINNTSYVSISLNDCMLTSEPGTAQLPLYSTHILIPDGCYIKGIGVSEQQFVDYSLVIEDKEILFAEEETPFSKPVQNETFQKNQSWYEINAFQPSQSFQSLGVSYMKGYPVETIHLYPMRYHPINHLLWFYKQLTITITFSYEESSLCCSSNQFFRQHDRDADQVSELVLNPELIDTYPLGNMSLGGADALPLGGGSLDETPIGDSYSGGLCDSSQRVDYVIVTTQSLAQNDSQTYNWSDLISHRQQRDGLSGEIVTMEEILVCEDYFNETACFNDSAARLREFCKDAYLDWHTEYILLGGTWNQNNEDQQIVPCRMLTDLDESAGYEDMPSDLYFSNLDGSWYFDTDVWGGGRGGANDKLSELSVGRIPVWTAEMVSHIVSKIIWYDNCEDTDFLCAAGFLGGDLGWTATSKQYMEEIRVGDGSFAQYEGFEEWNDAFPSYELDTSGRYYDMDYPSESAAISAWKTAINNNELCLISHLDHGLPSNTLSLSDGSTLSNDHFFLGTSQACLSGRYIGGASGASTFLGKWDDRGAFAMVLNTGYGYGSSSSTAGKSQLQHKMFWDYFFANQTTNFENWRLGLAMQYTKDMFSSYVDSLASHVYAYVWYSWNLFGDPAQRIRLEGNVNDAPQFHSVLPTDGADEIPVNQSQLSLIISDEDGDMINWSIQTCPDVGSADGSNESCGEKTCIISDLLYYTTYVWFVNVSDGSIWTNESFMFTTDIDPTDQLPIISNPLPLNNSTSIDVLMENISITLEDPDGDNLSCTVEGPYVNDQFLSNLSNTTITVNLTYPLPYNSQIIWYVNVSDHRSYPVREYFVFTTRDQYYPSVPVDCMVQTVNRTVISLNWTKNTSADATLIERNTLSQWNISEGIQVFNESGNTTTDANVLPGITYYYQIWGYNTTDMIWSNESILLSNRTVENILVNLSNPFPANNSVNCSVNLSFSINISDEENDLINWSIQVNDSFVNNSISDNNGIKSLSLSNLSYYTTYTVWVNATDGFNTTSEWFRFRTELPNDTIKPTIESVTFTTTETLIEDTWYGWDQLQCRISDNFRVSNVSLNSTTVENVTMNHSLTYSEITQNWTITFDDSLMNNTVNTLYAVDYNGNIKAHDLNLPALRAMLTFEENPNAINYLELPVDLEEIQWMMAIDTNATLNYTIETSPNMGSKQGCISNEHAVNISVNSLSYETNYEYRIALSHNLSQFELLLTFTTEEEPDDTNNFGSSPSSGNDVFIPPTAMGPMEEEQNLPPEIPLPPSGPAEITVGDTITVVASSWDGNNDQIRFLINWGDGTMSNWSSLVSSNETVPFTYVYQQSGFFDIKVKAQDDNELNSTWSQAYSVQVIDNEFSNSDNSGISVKVNNETGETYFDVHENITSSQIVSITWDFGDGTILDGFSPVHRYDKAGTYMVKVMITDEEGNVSMKTYKLTIPEPEQQVDTRIGSEETTSLPWIIVLIGIILSMVAAVVIVKFR